MPAHVHADGRVHGHDHAPVEGLKSDGGLKAAREAPARSLLRLSLAGRLAIAGGLVAAIWAAVVWAIA